MLPLPKMLLAVRSSSKLEYRSDEGNCHQGNDAYWNPKSEKTSNKPLEHTRLVPQNRDMKGFPS